MKKLLAIILSVLMLVSLVACTAKEKDNEEEKDPGEEVVGEGIKNPYTYYDTLDEINDLTGAKFAPVTVEGVSDEAYCTVNSTDAQIAQYSFKVNGIDYTYRFSPDFNADITGVYEGEGTIFENTDEEFVEFDGGKAAKHITADGQYTLVATGADDFEEFKSVAEKIFAGENASAGLANPYTYYETIDEIKNLTGAKFAQVEGATDETFSTIDLSDAQVAQYAFKLDGTDYTYRFSPDFNADITGVYENGGTVFQNTDENYVEFDGGKAARHITADGQYTLVAMGEGDFEEFKTLADGIFSTPSEFVNIANPYTYYDTIDEIMNLTGAKFAQVVGADDETFSTITSSDAQIAQYTFNADGLKYTCRFSPDFENDITGVWEDGKTLFEDTDETYVEFTGGKAAKHVTADGQYTLVVNDDGALTADQFKATAFAVFGGDFN